MATFIRCKKGFSFLLLSAFLIASDAVYAFTIYPVNYVSDYYVTVHYDFSSSYVEDNTDCTGGCNCYCDWSNRRVQAGSTNQGTNYFTYGTGSAHGSVGDYANGFAIGPGQVVNVYFSARYTVSNWLGVACAAACGSDYEIVREINAAQACRTNSIYAPTGFTASDSTSINSISLSWSNASDIPVGSRGFKVYRDGSLIATLSGSTTAYVDSGVSNSETHLYQVTTYTGSWGGHESSRFSAQDYGSTVYAHFSATDGSVYNKTNMTWKSIAAYTPTDIEVRRNGAQIAVINKNQTQYNDFDGIPGVKYLYSIAPLNGGTAIGLYADSGYSRPNGVFSGHVRSLAGAGVPGATVTATATVKGRNYSYAANTDASGYYQIKDVFYDTAAIYTLTPSKGTHGFNPPSLPRSLDIMNNIAGQAEFTDTSVFTVQGTVTYAGTTCGVKDAEIKLNGQFLGIKTDALGRYKLSINDEGDYSIGVSYGKHQFLTDSISVNVATDLTGINFSDIQKDTLFLDIKGGCHNQICDQAVFTITSDQNSPANCVLKNDTLNGVDPHFLVLPAMHYRVQLVDVKVNGITDANILNAPTFQIPKSIDLTKRDTILVDGVDTSYSITASDTLHLANGNTVITPADTIMIIDSAAIAAIPMRTATWIYHGELDIQVLNLPDPVSCTPPPGIDVPTLVSQYDRYPLQIQIREVSSYNGLVSQCFVDSGKLLVYDDVGANALYALPIVQGRSYFQLLPDDPEINTYMGNTHPHAKLLQFFAEVGNEDADTAIWLTVIGSHTRTGTFVTRSPEFPMYVLHDPPGDMSYSSLEKDSTYSFSLSTRKKTQFSAGAYLGVKLGKVAKMTLPLISVNIPGAYFDMQFEGLGGFDKDSANSVNISMRMNQTISTSGDPLFVGRNADVFVGASFNMAYALADIINWDENTCTVDRDTDIVWGVDSVTTTFIYTANHVKETLIPQYETLKSIVADTAKPKYQQQIDLWNQVLTSNNARIDTTNYTQNISFSAGAAFESSTTGDTTYEATYNYNNTADIQFSIGGGISDAELIDVAAGFKWQLHTEDATDKSSSTQKSITYKYHLEDGDPGDFFSVYTGKDPAYGSPMFKLLAGTSSCPYEAGTQARDLFGMLIQPAVVNNVPAETPASTVAYLQNQSESDEARYFRVIVDGATNLEGATVILGGQDITQFPASFYIPAGATQPAVLQVIKGPFANDYELTLLYSAACDEDQIVYGILDYGKARVRVHFLSGCSDVSVYAPSDNWLVNRDSRDTLPIIFSGYDPTNPNLIEVGFEYRRPGFGWIPGGYVPVSALTNAYYTYIFNTSALADGPYEIRAYALCDENGNTSKSYAPILHGEIDRTSVVLFGTPEPADGILNVNENISVTFNNVLDNQFFGSYDVTLTRGDNGQSVPASFTINNNQVIITTNPASMLDSLQNVILTAHVGNIHDENGNSLNTPVEWSFLVNRGKVFWDPSNKSVNVTQGVPAGTSAVIRNVGATQQDFFITSLPSWLTVSNIPNLANPTPVPGSNGTFTIFFAVSNGLNPGAYDDTVIATVNGIEQWLHIHLDVVKPAPDWSVNPAFYQHSMNIIANFSTTQANAPLSTDTRDKIAVFVGEQCRGVADIQYVPSVNRYVAFITAYSNVAVGDTFTFRMWKAIPGTEYQATNQLPFVADGVIGQALAPYILHPAGVFQTIPLTTGWNWFSLNVTQPDMSTANVLKSITPETGNVVKTLSGYSQFNASNWYGTLDTFIAKEKSYMLYLNKPDTLRFLGQPVTDTTTVSLPAGWNWIGFPRQDIASVNDFLSTLPAQNNDVFKSQTQFSTYSGGLWSGTLNYAYPGEGYKLKTANAVNFTIPPDRSTPNWAANANQYEYNMVATSVLQFNGVDARESHYLIGAFINNVCVGTGQPEYVPALNAYRIFLTIHGEQGMANSPLEFRVYDIDNDIEYTPSYDAVNFGPDSTVGRVANPFALNIQVTGIEALAAQGYSLLQNVPNPFTGPTIVEYAIPENEHVTIHVYDQTGKLLGTPVDELKNAGHYKIKFDTDKLPQGIYYYQMSAGQFRKTRKMVIF